MCRTAVLAHSYPAPISETMGANMNQLESWGSLGTHT